MKQTTHRWIGHVMRASPERIIRQCSEEISPGKRPLERLSMGD